MSRPWMPLYVADYLGDTGHLSTIEHGAYMLLIMHYWQQEKLPTDETRLARIARMSPEEWSNARATLEALFEPGWKHSRIDVEIAVTDEKYEARAKAGHLGGKASALARKQAKLLANEQQSSSNASSNATAKSNQPPSHPHLPKEVEKKEAREIALSSAEPSDFDAFWSEWPNKVGKPAALKAFNSAVRRGALLWDIQDGLRNYVRDKPPDRPWLNPATFLNQNRWEDQPASASAFNGYGTSNYRTDPSAGRATGREAQQIAAMGRGAISRLEERAPARRDGEIPGCAGVAEIVDLRKRAEGGY